MIQYVLRYWVRIGDKSSVRMKKFSASNDRAACHLASTLWRELRKHATVPRQSVLFGPRLLRDSHAISVTFSDGD
ncbi:MAG TPA: hypothetical protein DDW41_03590 [Candidatus Andersenbacteria bacterium]|nr:hypothetical protein [Candidatus Andersenbacteria bacterium]